ncbi:hypothetical protein [Duganella sp. Root1480D1]|uniref:hypothetical protein n=1 Tax=Duganella sp. Root1480D1 TaxID=1736471 RepID=UPI0012E3E8E9|nr:hypothetical protein [Duganella sp. Root1480D1]
MSQRSYEEDDGVPVPIPIMYRFYHIGRAYDLHQLKNFSPRECSAIDFISMNLLIAELEALRELINDSVLNHYGDQLIDYVKRHSIDSKSRMILSA